MKFKISEKHFIWGVFGVALIARLAVALWRSPQDISLDSFDWMNLGQMIASGQGFGDSWRPPGYAFYLGGLFFVFGKSLLAIKIFNSVLGAITCVLIYFIGKKLFNWQVGRISSVLVCFYPYLLAYAGDAISETFMAFMIALSMLCIIACAEKPSYGNILIAGVVMGLASLTKSTVLPFYALACLWIMWKSKTIKAGFFAGILTLLTISPWTLRNYFYYHEFVPISTGGGSLYMSNNDGALFLESVGEADSPLPMQRWPGMPYDEYDAILKLPKIQADKVFNQKAMEWIRNNDDKFIYLLGARFLHFWRLYPMMAYKWQKLAAMATSGVYIPLAILGVFLSYKNFKNTSLLITLFIEYTLVYIFFSVVLRYRVPIDPYIIIFASYTLFRFYRLFKPEQPAL